MTANDDNAAAWIVGTIRDPITAANILRINADGSINATLSGATGGLLAIQTFTATGTYTPTAGMAHCLVYATGNGGGGGGVAAGGSSGQSGGGGGAGSTSIALLTAAQIGA